ncbi:MAG: hypothetical protein BWZ07_02111 [Alphaproteobacteria bacterium ADurb.BinA280]|nr:MAG: hypothetical protein BWZ07_02111 [Alphaproteobacteria bacterium ADurb.BinA280]
MFGFEQNFAIETTWLRINEIVDPTVFSARLLLAIDRRTGDKDPAWRVHVTSGGGGKIHVAGTIGIRRAQRGSQCNHNQINRGRQATERIGVGQIERHRLTAWERKAPPPNTGDTEPVHTQQSRRTTAEITATENQRMRRRGLTDTQINHPRKQPRAQVLADSATRSTKLQAHPE